jgi:hypothetical protein
MNHAHLCYQAAKLAVGTLNADEIKQMIQILSEDDFYIDELLDLPNDLHPSMFDMLPVFLAILNHYAIIVPSPELAVWQLIEYHLQRIVSNEADPTHELYKIVDNVYIIGLNLVP